MKTLYETLTVLALSLTQAVAQIPSQGASAQTSPETVEPANYSKIIRLTRSILKSRVLGARAKS